MTCFINEEHRAAEEEYDLLFEELKGEFMENGDPIQRRVRDDILRKRHGQKFVASLQKKRNRLKLLEGICDRYRSQLVRDTQLND